MVPASYEEGMLWLDGRRRLHQVLPPQRAVPAPLPQCVSSLASRPSHDMSRASRDLPDALPQALAMVDHHAGFVKDAIERTA